MAAVGFSDGENFVVQSVSSDVGRGLVALRDFRPGETVLREAPLVSAQFAWNKAYKYAACDFCLTPLESAQENVLRLSASSDVLLPNAELCTTRKAFHAACPHCAERYCSAQCRDDAWAAHHRTLCLQSPDPDLAHPLVLLHETWKTSHYPPESCSIELMARILASIVQADDGGAALSAKYLSFMHATSASDGGDSAAHKLLGEEFASRVAALRAAAAPAFPQPAVQWFLTPDGFSALLALVARNGQGCGTSAFGQWVKAVGKAPLRGGERARVDALIDAAYDAIDAHAGPFLDNEGSGLYELQSALNHSCAPNAIIAFPFNNHELVVNASSAIAAGDEIRISYLDECDAGRSRHSRRKMLRENYLFSCRCTKCEAQLVDPDVTSEEEMEDEDEED